MKRQSMKQHVILFYLRSKHTGLSLETDTEHPGRQARWPLTESAVGAPHRGARRAPLVPWLHLRAWEVCSFLEEREEVTGGCGGPGE